MLPVGSPHCRVLYIDLAPSIGGSIVSLYHLIKCLDRTRYQPVVVMRASNKYASEFEALGVQVLRLGHEPHAPSARSSSKSPAQGARWSRLFEVLRSASIVQWLKRRACGERLVHLVGFYSRSFPGLVREARELAHIMGDVKPDLVHLNDVVCVSRSGIMAARWAGVPAVCHLRAMAWRNHFDRWISRWLKGYICISHAVDAHQRTLGGRIAPSWVVYNGTELIDANALPSRVQARQEFGWDDSHQVVGCVGRLVRWKGQDVFVRALGLLVERYPHLRALIVGGQAINELEYAAHLQNLVQEAGLSDVVCFTGHRQDLPRVLRAMDIMVHSSVAPEPFGRVLIEAMAAGVTVIGSDAGAVPEIVEHERTGLLVTPGDPEAMAEAIESALLSPEKRAQWQLVARQVVAERFSAADYAMGVQCVYGIVLDD